jgi:hypothetical protein
MKKLLPCALSALLLSALSLSGTVFNQVLLSETFANPDRTTTNLPGSTAWYSATGTAGEHVVYTQGTGLTLLSAASSSRHVVGYFTTLDAGPITLQPGDTIRLQYNVTFTNPDPNNAGSPSSNSFRAGLFNSNFAMGTPRVTADGLGGVSTTNTPSYYHDYVGYRFDTILHNNSTSPQARVYRRNIGAEGTSFMAVSTAYTAALAATDVPATLFPAGTYEGIAEITRLLDGSVSFIHTLTGLNELASISASVSGLDTSESAVYSYDTVGFNIGSRVTESFTLHSVTVEVIPVPEPATLALCVGLLAGCMVFLRRTRNRRV